jgi:hypothetical protein
LTESSFGNSLPPSQNLVDHFAAHYTGSASFIRPSTMSGQVISSSSLARSTAIHNWNSLRRACLPTRKPRSVLLPPCTEPLTVSSISQSRSYRTSRPANQFSTYLSPAERAEQRRKEQADALAKAMDKNFTREWKKGDIYAPHDLSAAEARKWRKKYTPTIDAFDALSLNPLDFYKVQLFHFQNGL